MHKKTSIIPSSGQKNRKIYPSQQVLDTMTLLMKRTRNRSSREYQLILEELYEIKADLEEIEDAYNVIIHEQDNQGKYVS